MAADAAAKYDPDNPEVPQAMTDDQINHMHGPAGDDEPEPTPGFKRLYADRSLGYFELDNPIRRACMHVSESPLFDNFILLAIAANAIILCFMEPLKMPDRGCDGVASASLGGNAVVEQTEVLFTVIFTIECVIKVVAMGFVLDETSYLKDGWNVMDFVVVVVSLLSNLPGMGSNVSALRVIRVLRPLRTLSMFPGMRVLIGTMIRSVPMIANVMLFCVFFFTIFGIFGLQVFMGTLRNRCFTVVSETTCAADHAENEDAVYCRDVVPSFGNDLNVTAAVLLADDDEQTCTNHTLNWPGYRCPEGQMCLKGNNPNYGITNFDDFAYACLTIFQCITLEGWTPIMYMTMDSVTGWTVVYFLLLVFTGGFFLLNLALAVITEVYDEESTDAKEEAASEEIEAEAEQERKEAEARQKRHDLGLFTDDEASDEELDPLDTKIDFAALEGKENPAKKACKALIEHPAFGPFFTVLILINTLLLSMEYADMPSGYAKGLEVCNLILTIMFIFELVLKVGGLGFTEYGKDNFNLFDAVVVLISIIELAAAGSGSLSALRAFRILRVLKLIRSWTSLQNFLYTVYLTVLDLGNFSFIVLLVIFIFALLGMQLFGGKMCGLDDGDTPRHNFDTLLWALVTVFQVLTGEDWNAVMYDGMAANGSWSALYFVLLLVIGNFLVLNLFIAILLTNFSAQEINSEYDSTRKVLDSVSFFSYMSKEKKKQEKTPEEIEEERFWAELPDKEFAPRALSNWECLAEVFLTRVWEEERIKREEHEAMLAAEEEARLKRIEEERAIAEGRLQRAKLGHLVSFATDNGEGGVSCGSMPGAGPKPLHKFQGKALMLFDVEHPVRKICHRIVDDKQFEMIIMVCIVLSSLTMAFESPAALEDKSFADALEAVDIVFTIIFLAEMLMKLVAYGLYMEDPDSYLRDPWNCMDGTIVVIGLVGKILSGANMEWVRALRTMRVLRPLRVISRVPELKVVVNALLNSIPGLGNVFLVSLLFWIIFGILGMQLFMGAFARCSDEDVDARVDCVDGWVNSTVEMRWDSVAKECNHPTTMGLTAQTCVGEFNQTTFVEREWKSDDMNFDNIFNAMQTLFEMSTTEGWTAVMYNGVDSRSPELAPERDHNPPIAFFFVAFEVVANFFILNLFVGIILDNFAQLSSETGDGSSATMTKAQKMWVKTQQRLQGAAEPARADYYPEDPNRRVAYKVIERREFEWGIMFVIVMNAVTMACERYDASRTLTNALEGLGIFYAVVFVGEAALKLYAMYPAAYFADRWNCFDFFCVATTLIGYMAGSGGIASVLRILRLARVFRLVRKLKGLRMLFNTLIISLPGLLNIGALLFLLCFVYAILGMNLFGKVKFGENLNRDSNFTNFGNSLLVLLRMVTGEAWNAIMYDCMISEDCDKSVDCARGECCGSAGAPMYFISFVIFGSFITLNLLIAVVLDNFSNNKKEEGVQVTEEHIQDFADAWSKIDPHATGFIQLTRLVSLLKLAGAPLGVRGTKLSRLGLLRFQKNLNLKVDSNYLHYQDVLQAVTARAMGINIDQLPIDVRTALEVGKVRKRLVAERKMSKMSESGVEGVPEMNIAHGMVGVEGEELDIAQLYAVERIQAAFRGRQARKREREAREAREEERRRAKAETILTHVKDLMRSVEEEQRTRRLGTVGDSAAASRGASEQSYDRDSARDAH